MKNILIFILVSLVSCKSIEKATQQVLTDKKAFAEVGEKWSELNPCNEQAPETTFIKGKDIIVEKPVLDTASIRKKLDSLAAVYSSSYDCEEDFKEGFQLGREQGYEEAVKNYRKPVPDTFRITLPPDTREKAILLKRVQELENENSFKAGKLIQVTTLLNKYEKYALLAIIVFMLLGVIIGKLLPSLPNLFRK